MNFFVFWKNEKGEDELITPPLDGTILPGVTRDSILNLCKEKNEFKVSVNDFRIQDFDFGLGFIKGFLNFQFVLCHFL